MKPTPSRRGFLRLSVFALTALAGSGAILSRPDLGGGEDSLPEGGNWSFLGAADRALISVFAPALLFPCWPLEPARAAAELARLLRGVDTAVAYLPRRSQEELRQLLGLLARPSGRLLLCAGRWAGRHPRLDDGSAEAILTAWRDAAWGVLQAAYAGLHDLIMAVWYGDPGHWAELGYGGPPLLPRGGIDG